MPPKNSPAVNFTDIEPGLRRDDQTPQEWLDDLVRASEKVEPQGKVGDSLDETDALAAGFGNEDADLFAAGARKVEAENLPNLDVNKLNLESGIDPDAGVSVPQLNLRNRNVMTPELVAIALYEARGFESVAARKLGTTVRVVKQYVKDYEVCQVAKDESEHMLLDFAEAKLLQKIKAGDIASLIFYLKTKGKKRGYIEKAQDDRMLMDEERAREEAEKEKEQREQLLSDRLQQIGDRLSKIPSMDVKIEEEDEPDTIDVEPETADEGA